jgi:pyruvate kinase
MTGGKVSIPKGQILQLTTDESRKANGDHECFYCDYKALCSTVRLGQKIFVADGSLTLEVMAIDPAGVYLTCKVWKLSVLCYFGC